MSRPHFLRSLLCLGLALVWVTAAQGKPKRRTPQAPAVDANAAAEKIIPAEKAVSAQLRLWKATDSPDLVLQIRLLKAGDKSTQKDALTPLVADGRNYQFSNYVEVPSGPGVIEVSAADRPTVNLPVNFAEGAYATLLVRAQSGGLSAELIDDTAKRDETGADFGVYNLLASGKGGDLQIKLGDTLDTRLTSPSGSLHLRGLKRALYPITISGADTNGKPFRWTTEADFRHSRKATLLIYPDPYGRIRPRLSIDGDAAVDSAGNATAR
jgi:hypothetical protein